MVHAEKLALRLPKQDSLDPANSMSSTTGIRQGAPRWLQQ